MTDLMAWNSDQTRMPARMHGRVFAQPVPGEPAAAGRFAVDGR